MRLNVASKRLLEISQTDGAPKLVSDGNVTKASGQKYRSEEVWFCVCRRAQKSPNIPKKLGCSAASQTSRMDGTGTRATDAKSTRQVNYCHDQPTVRQFSTAQTQEDNVRFVHG